MYQKPANTEEIIMARTFSEIENEAMQLSRQERAVLVERLLTTLDVGEDIDAEELWLQEAERRYQEYRAGRLASKPAAQVFEDAKKRLP
jgi:putative addiction module component (TIGR02574 family)